MLILVLNCGSSSVKYALYDWDKNSLITKGNLERIGLEGGYSSHKEAIEKMKEESKTDIPKIARKLATKLRNDEEYYLYLSNKCKKLYQELYTETKFKEKFNL